MPEVTQKELTQIQTRERPTIMDGKVVTFATGFAQNHHDNVFMSDDPIGPFEVSASRNAVMVHRASCRNTEEVEALIEAIRQAEQTRKRLSI